jgi:hypothetical protein
VEEFINATSTMPPFTGGFEMFKDSLRKKIALDRMARRVEDALPEVRPEYEGIDKDLVRDFLAQTPFEPVKLRDLELYKRGGDGLAEEVLVLDNELPLYKNVSPEEVAMRRSPEVKEMFSVKNIKKIMSDQDIIVARGRKAIAHIHDEAVGQLDLTYGADDIRGLERSAKEAFAAGRTEELTEVLDLFFELLGYQEIESVDDELLFGRPEPEGYRDVVIISGERPDLRLARGLFAPEEDESMDALAEMASGARPADAEGEGVLSFLSEEVLRLKAA